MKRYFSWFLVAVVVADTSPSHLVPRTIQVLDGLLKDICTALLEADVNVRLVQTLRKNIKSIVNVDELASGLNKQRVIQKVR